MNYVFPLFDKDTRRFLAAAIVASGMNANPNGQSTWSEIAEVAVTQADAILEELEKRQ